MFVRSLKQIPEYLNSASVYNRTEGRSDTSFCTVSTSPQLKVKVGWLCDRKHWLTLGSVPPSFAFSCAFINRKAPAEQLLRRLRAD